jgi:hypothetical protein
MGARLQEGIKQSQVQDGDQQQAGHAAGWHGKRGHGQAWLCRYANVSEVFDNY